MPGISIPACRRHPSGQPVAGLAGAQRGGGAAVRGGLAQGLLNLVDAAIAHETAFVIIAGDLYDGDWKDYATGQFFVREAARAGRAGIKLFLIRGNHDAASEISRALPLPECVHQFSARKVESVELAELGVVLHGRSFAQRHVADNMAGEFPAARPGWCNIGVLHTSLTGRDGHDVYAPCSLDDLLRVGYQYWALGHIHAREVVHADPPVVFPGNLQGRHARETGPKGATLVTVDNNGVTKLEALDLDAARWEPRRSTLPGWRRVRALHDAVRAAADAAGGRLRGPAAGAAAAADRRDRPPRPAARRARAVRRRPAGRRLDPVGPGVRRKAHRRDPRSGRRPGSACRWPTSRRRSPLPRRRPSSATISPPTWT
jgi:DNA repair protein SbcD/Mre11